MRSGIAVLAMALLCAHGAARATLGEPSTAAAASRARIAAAGSLPGGVRIVESRSADGGVLREFVAPSGVVFEVRWSTRLKPRLENLLGRYHAAYAGAAAQARQRPGVQRQATLRADDLVVETRAHLNNHSGRAWVPSLVPAGFDASAVR